MAQTLTAPITANQLAEIQQLVDDGALVAVWADTPRGSQHGTVDFISATTDRIQFLVVSDNPARHGEEETVGLAQIQELEVLS